MGALAQAAQPVSSGLWLVWLGAGMLGAACLGCVIWMVKLLRRPAGDPTDPSPTVDHSTASDPPASDPPASYPPASYPTVSEETHDEQPA